MCCIDAMDDEKGQLKMQILFDVVLILKKTMRKREQSADRR